MSDMVNKQYIIYNEITFKSLLDEQMLKLLDGEEIAVDIKFKDPSTIYNSVPMLFISNYNIKEQVTNYFRDKLDAETYKKSFNNFYNINYTRLSRRFATIYTPYTFTSPLFIDELYSIIITHEIPTIIDIIILSAMIGKYNSIHKNPLFHNIPTSYIKENSIDPLTNKPKYKNIDGTIINLNSFVYKSDIVKDELFYNIANLYDNIFTSEKYRFKSLFLSQDMKNNIESIYNNQNKNSYHINEIPLDDYQSISKYNNKFKLNKYSNINKPKVNTYIDLNRDVDIGFIGYISHYIPSMSDFRLMYEPIKLYFNKLFYKDSKVYTTLIDIDNNKHIIYRKENKNK